MDEQGRGQVETVNGEISDDVAIVGSVDVEGGKMAGLFGSDDGADVEGDNFVRDEGVGCVHAVCDVVVAELHLDGGSVEEVKEGSEGRDASQRATQGKVALMRFSCPADIRGSLHLSARERSSTATGLSSCNSCLHAVMRSPPGPHLGIGSRRVVVVRIGCSVILGGAKHGRWARGS